MTATEWTGQIYAETSMNRFLDYAKKKKKTTLFCENRVGSTACHPFRPLTWVSADSVMRCVPGTDGGTTSRTHDVVGNIHVPLWRKHGTYSVATWGARPPTSTMLPSFRTNVDQDGKNGWLFDGYNDAKQTCRFLFNVFSTCITVTNSSMNNVYRICQSSTWVTHRLIRMTQKLAT